MTWWKFTVSERGIGCIDKGIDWTPSFSRSCSSFSPLAYIVFSPTKTILYHSDSHISLARYFVFLQYSVSGVMLLLFIVAVIFFFRCCHPTRRIWGTFDTFSRYTVALLRLVCTLYGSTVLFQQFPLLLRPSQFQFVRQRQNNFNFQFIRCNSHQTMGKRTLLLLLCGQFAHWIDWEVANWEKIWATKLTCSTRYRKKAEWIKIVSDFGSGKWKLLLSETSAPTR